MLKEKIRVRVLKEIWQKYHSGRSWHQFDRWLEREYKSNPSFGKKDRRWYSEYLFAGFRFADLAFHLLESDVDFLKNNTDEFWALIEARLQSAEPYFKELNADSYQKVETFRAQFQENDGSIERQLLWAGIPLPWKAHIEERSQISGWSKEEEAKFISYFSEKAPLWIRLNYSEQLENLKKELSSLNILVLEERGDALCLESTKSMRALKSFEQGVFDIQDFASQEILQSEQVDFQKLHRIWDACAGAGGKTLQLAALKKNKGAIFASDIRLHKLEELKKRVQRAKFKPIQCFEWQGEALDVSKFKEPFDFVLVDAPCSSSGVLRRNPELRFKLNFNELRELHQLQLKLLSSASRQLRPGGYLCYGTCSFFKVENEDVVKSFCEQNKDFKLIHQQLHGLPYKNSDATFSALLQRCSTSQG